MDLNQLEFGGSVSKGGGPRRSPWMVNLNQTSSTTAIIIDFQGPFSYTAQLISGTFIDYITNWSAARQSVISSSSSLPTFSNQGDLVFVQTPTIVSFNTQAGNDLVFLSIGMPPSIFTLVPAMIWQLEASAMTQCLAIGVMT